MFRRWRARAVRNGPKPSGSSTGPRRINAKVSTNVAPKSDHPGSQAPSHFVLVVELAQAEWPPRRYSVAAEDLCSRRPGIEQRLVRQIRQLACVLL
jgi:hypothetical protein